MPRCLWSKKVPRDTHDSADPLHTATARRTVRAMVRKYPPNIERDDLMQEALLRIWLHTVEHGPVSADYASSLARWAVLDYLRREIPMGRARQREECPVYLVPLEENHEPTTGDITLDTAAARQQLRRVAAAMAGLSDRERASLDDGLCSQANAGRWGVTHTRMSQVRGATRDKLRDAAGLPLPEPPQPIESRDARMVRIRMARIAERITRADLSDCADIMRGFDLQELSA